MDSFLPIEERIIIYKLNGEEKIHFPKTLLNWAGEFDLAALLNLLKKYHKALEVAEKMPDEK